MKNQAQSEPSDPTYSQPLMWNDDGYGSPSRIVVVTADSFAGLREAIRLQRWSREIHSPYDCTGIEFCRTAKILHVGETDAGHSAVLLITSHYDV
jgi:hypothetical protein